MPNDVNWWKRSRANRDGARQLLSACDLELPAASRNYYSLFQAVIAVLTKSNKHPADFQSGETRWRHGMIDHNLRSVPALLACAPDLNRLFKRLRSRRETADYGPDFPGKEDVREDHAALLPMLERLGSDS